MFSTLTAVMQPRQLPVISIGQALLIMIDHYKKSKVSSDQLQQTEKLYLAGANTPEDHDTIDKIIAEGIAKKLLTPYVISKDPKVINEDSVRRYFETHLAYETLRHDLPSLSIDDLKNHKQQLVKLLNPDRQEKVLTYNINHPCFVDIYRQLKKDKNFCPDLSQVDKDKLVEIYMCAYAGDRGCSLYNDVMPLAKIYKDGNGFFQSNNRGRKNRADTNSGCYSYNFGLQKSYMATPDTLIDRAESKSITPCVKFPDRQETLYDSEWAKYSFGKLVHPFSASISGTFLAQIRCLLDMKDKKSLIFNDAKKLELFLKCFMAKIVYISGSHTMYELAAVLSYKEVTKAFSDLPGARELDLTALFYDNKAGSVFDRALEDTIKYNKVMLAKVSAHAEMRSQPYGLPCAIL